MHQGHTLAPKYIYRRDVPFCPARSQHFRVDGTSGTEATQSVWEGGCVRTLETPSSLTTNALYIYIYYISMFMYTGQLESVTESFVGCDSANRINLVDDLQLRPVLEDQQERTRYAS